MVFNKIRTILSTQYYQSQVMYGFVPSLDWSCIWTTQNVFISPVGNYAGM